MKDEPDGRVPHRRRGPNSIWERYLTGKLSLEDKETLPALIKELHREIAQHLGQKVDAEKPEEVAPLDIDFPASPLPRPKPKPLEDVSVRRVHIAKRRRIDPRQN